MTRLIDLTHGFYDGMPSYPADWFPKFASERTMTPETDPYGTKRTFSYLHVFPHNGTHMEYRLHFFPGTEGSARFRCVTDRPAPASPTYPQGGWSQSPRDTRVQAPCGGRATGCWCTDYLRNNGAGPLGPPTVPGPSAAGGPSTTAPTWWAGLPHGTVPATPESRAPRAARAGIPLLSTSPTCTGHQAGRAAFALPARWPAPRQHQVIAMEDTD
jgi:hypothetical protein